MRGAGGFLPILVHLGDSPPLRKQRLVLCTRSKILHGSPSSVLQSFEPHAEDWKGTEAYHSAQLIPREMGAAICRPAIAMIDGSGRGGRGQLLACKQQYQSARRCNYFVRSESRKGILRCYGNCVWTGKCENPAETGLDLGGSFRSD